MNENYMDAIYDVIYAPEVEVNEQGIEYLDEPIDEQNFYDDDLAWADDITYLDEPEDEEFDLDLGEGFIPLPQGEQYHEELIVIDENYILDEFEEDLIDNYEKPTVAIEKEEVKEEYDFNDIYNLLDSEDEIILDEVESIIHFPVNNEPKEEELQNINMDDETSKLALSIAKEHMDNVKAGEVAGGLFGDLENPEDDTSWVKDDNDLFGADISVIIAEDPNKEVEDEEFVEGSFEDWLAKQNSN
jgi:hypothetical protein